MVFALFIFQPILGEFNKEQEAFIKGQSGKSTEAGVCPWVGHTNEDKIKEEILSLSAVSLYSYNLKFFRSIIESILNDINLSRKNPKIKIPLISNSGPTQLRSRATSWCRLRIRLRYRISSGSGHHDRRHCARKDAL